MLEAIKLFLEVPGVVFVLGMDREVVRARHRGALRRISSTATAGRRAELPISGDSYLQKIVQIPFHLPPLARRAPGRFHGRAGPRAAELTRQVFARGLYPNPRTVKRALNIFHLLQEIALEREKHPVDEGGLPFEAIAWPLLAKTVVIQTQYPRRVPAVAARIRWWCRRWKKTSAAPRRRSASASRRCCMGRSSVLRGRLLRRPAGTGDEEEAPAAGAAGERQGGLLDEYLKTDKPQDVARLAQLLAFPPKESEERGGRERARFAGLTRAQLAAYTQLAGVAEAQEAPPVEVPADLLAALLSGDRVQMQDAAGRLQEEEPQKEGPKHEAHRARLVQVLGNPGEPLARRMSAGEALGWIGDRREGVCTREPDLDPDHTMS